MIEEDRSRKEMSLEELQSLLEELETEKAILVQLKSNHPEIAKLENDMSLKAGEHKIWQDIQRLILTKFRITAVNKSIAKKSR